MSAIITGRKPVIEALRAGTHIEKIVLLPGVQGTVIAELKNLATAKGVPLVEAARQEFRELASDKTTQGVVAVLATVRKLAEVETIIARASEDGTRGFIIILDGIEDPQNLGALIRSAECAGAHGVIIPKHHAASVTPTVVKASAGATEHLPIAEATNLIPIIEELKKTGYWIVGLEMEGSTEYTAVDYRTPIALVVGSEGKGMRRLVREHCDHLVRIPIRGKVDSLNASVAGAIVMYEVVRQRK